MSVGWHWLTTSYVLGEFVGKDSRWKRYKWSRLTAVAALGGGDTSECPLSEEASDGEEGFSEGDAAQPASLEAVPRVEAAREKASMRARGVGIHMHWGTED